MGLTLAQARTILRRRLQEPTADQWANADLDSLIGLGILEAQQLVQGADADAYLTEFKDHLVDGTSDYAFPAGSWWPVEVAILDSDTGEYADLGRPYGRLENADIQTGETPRWAIFGRYIRIFPTPSENVVQGLRINAIKSLVIGADGDQLPVPDPLHGLTVLYAERWAIGETGEAADEVNKAIDRQEAKFPMWFRRSGAGDRVTVDHVKDYD